MNCEILKGGTVTQVRGDPYTHQPKRSTPGTSRRASSCGPATARTRSTRPWLCPPAVAFGMSLIDPAGFERIEYGYRSVGVHFWTPQAYRAGQLAKKLRAPLMVAVVAAVAALAVKVCAK